MRVCEREREKEAVDRKRYDTNKNVYNNNYRQYCKYFFKIRHIIYVFIIF